MKTLHLKFTKSCIHHPGVWSPLDPEDKDQTDVFGHFSGGMMAISFERLREFITVASIHGIKVTTKGWPDKGPDACAE